MSGLVPVQEALSASRQQLVVNIAADTGPVLHEANGALYGLTHPGTPSINTLIPLKPYLVEQKPTGGLQHPGGDATYLGNEFSKVGGKQIFIYMQDIYAHFPYEHLGIKSYLAHVTSIVRTVLATSNPDLYVFVPFNEPDWIWYNTGSNEQIFFQDWRTVYRKIKSLYPKAKIAGPNLSYYNAAFFSDFLYFCRENHCLPDIFTWHELNPNSLAGWSTDYASYRSIESGLGIKPIPVCITEYGNFRDLSVPGRLVQWISKFENSKVSAAMAYWHAAGNMDDLIVQNAFGNGAWWLFKWYADMTGDTVQVTPPVVDTTEGLQGLASLDKRNRQVHILFGGASGNSDIVINGFSTAKYFGTSVHVTVWESDWSGYEGASNGPALKIDGIFPVINGRVVVPVSNMKASAAYNMIITPATDSGDTKWVGVQQPWSASYEAEKAKITDAKVLYGGSDADANNNYNSGGARVGYINNPDSLVRFTVHVPYSGRYAMTIFYDNGWRNWALQRLKVDNHPWQLIEYPTDIAWNFVRTKVVYVNLSKGVHTITFGAYPDPNHIDANTVELDRIDLTFLPPRNSTPDFDVINRYAAEYAQLSGSAVVEYGKNSGYPGHGYVSGYENSNSASTNFVVSVDKDGFYDVRLCYSAGPVTGSPNDRVVKMQLNGSFLEYVDLPSTGSWDKWGVVDEKIFLQAGINNITFSAFTNDNRDDVVLNYIDLTPDHGDSKKILTLEAESKKNSLGGIARVLSDPHASGGKYVALTANTKGSSNIKFNDIHVPESGLYRLVIRYSNGEFVDANGGVNSYNLNVVDCAADISVNGGASKRVYFRNTYADNNFWTTVMDVYLRKGMNTIEFSNKHSGALNIDNIQIASAFLDDASHGAN
ncbi:delta endotoxin C-terminal domain-containing protein [Alicyclobacillus cellulosilyticus]|uniref:delta endotoxin C-terminal domain-containing protein n=1 Tax=Alicyclobacillus cellulosilyticus TaxID=1003997 RepID=UPI00166BF7BF|nr:delta endotoxin C-terminal domain-containing protein [Alicyclobacillus cellulosilyticus]